MAEVGQAGDGEPRPDSEQGWQLGRPALHHRADVLYGERLARPHGRPRPGASSRQDQEVERAAHGVSGALQPLTTCAVVRGTANACTKPRLDISPPAVDSRFPLDPRV